MTTGSSTLSIDTPSSSANADVGRSVITIARIRIKLISRFFMGSILSSGCCIRIKTFIGVLSRSFPKGPLLRIYFYVCYCTVFGVKSLLFCAIYMIYNAPEKPFSSVFLILRHMPTNPAFFIIISPAARRVGRSKKQTRKIQHFRVRLFSFNCFFQSIRFATTTKRPVEMYLKQVDNTRISSPNATSIPVS